MGNISQQETVFIADLVQLQNLLTYYGKKPYETKFFSPMIGMPMDMEYAHYAGLEGHRIYYRAQQWDYLDIHVSTAETSSNTRHILPPRPEHVDSEKPLSKRLAAEFAERRKEEESRLGACYESANYHKTVVRGSSRTKRYFVVEIMEDSKTDALRRVPIWLESAEMRVFRTWDMQVRDIKYAALKHPWRHIPFYHYEPRRWAGKKRTFIDESAGPDKPGVFLGVKMYPSLGFKPNDRNRIKGLQDFYRECSQNQIPILSHCSPAGMYTHERPLFFQFDSPPRESYEQTRQAYIAERCTPGSSVCDRQGENWRCLGHKLGRRGETGANGLGACTLVRSISGWDMASILD